VLFIVIGCKGYADGFFNFDAKDHNAIVVGLKNCYSSSIKEISRTFKVKVKNVDFERTSKSESS